MIKVKIPATSANLGAGFDSLGLAVNMYNYVSVEESDRIDISSSDNTKVPTSKNNLVFSSAKQIYELCGKPFKGLKIIQENNIPMTRGLGSSSACIIGGLAGANALLKNPLSTDDIVNLAAKLEGHPDNTTPALLGGIVTAAMDGGRVYWVKQEVNTSLKLIAVIPDFRLSTAMARRALPKSVSHKDARFNLSRAALFSASIIQGKYENIKTAVDDRLHQPYRLKLINHGRDVFEKCYDLGAYGVYISGAGPTIMAIAASEKASFAAEIKQYLLKSGLQGWRVEELAIDNAGTVISEI